MTSDRDRSDEGAGWPEPSHPGGDRTGDDAARPADAAGQRWEPPGWSLPPAERQGPRPAAPQPTHPPPPAQDVDGPGRDEPGYGVDPRAAGAPEWPGRDPRGVVQQVFSYQGDLVG